MDWLLDYLLQPVTKLQLLAHNVFLLICWLVLAVQLGRVARSQGEHQRQEDRLSADLPGSEQAAGSKNRNATTGPPRRRGLGRCTPPL